MGRSRSSVGLSKEIDTPFGPRLCQLLCHGIPVARGISCLQDVTEELTETDEEDARVGHFSWAFQGSFLFRTSTKSPGARAGVICFFSGIHQQARGKCWFSLPWLHAFVFQKPQNLASGPQISRFQGIKAFGVKQRLQDSCLSCQNDADWVCPCFK